MNSEAQTNTHMVIVLTDFFGLTHYLAGLDPDANRGQGRTSVTTDPAKAMRFATSDEAMAMWRTPSRTYPRRADGSDNRPLTAFNIRIQAVAASWSLSC